MYQVMEYRFKSEAGYEFIPATTPRSTVRQAERDRVLLERRYREEEDECRIDWSRLESGHPLLATLKHFGDRARTRLFAVRKGGE